MHTTPATKTSSVQHRQSYVTLGYTLLDVQISTTDLVTVRLELDNWIGSAPDVNSYGILRNNVYQQIPALRNFLSVYRLGQIACHLLDCDEVILFQDNLIWKPSGTTQQVQWHQDYAYWPLSSPDGITFWFALDDCFLNNGCMSYIPRSHSWGECQPTDFTESSTQHSLANLQQLPVQQHLHLSTAIELQAGQGVAHHPLLAHMSHPNVSNHPRRGWSLTWIKPSVRWDPNHAPHPYPIFHRVQKGDTVKGEDFPRFVR